MSINIEETRKKLFSDLAVIISVVLFIIFLVILINDQSKEWALAMVVISSLLTFASCYWRIKSISWLENFTFGRSYYYHNDSKDPISAIITIFVLMISFIVIVYVPFDLPRQIYNTIILSKERKTDDLIPYEPQE